MQLIFVISQENRITVCFAKHICAKKRRQKVVMRWSEEELKFVFYLYLLYNSKQKYEYIRERDRVKNLIHEQFGVVRTDSAIYSVILKFKEIEQYYNYNTTTIEQHIRRASLLQADLWRRIVIDNCFNVQNLFSNDGADDFIALIEDGV